jgi:N-dimethylarginine dimethylaminohydrolase
MTEQKATVCQSEYDRLTRVIVAEPTYMAITEVINETQKHFLSDNIDTEVATHQHQMFVDVLKNEGIKVEYLPVKDHLNEQVFTRDIGFTLGETLFIANMASDIRKEETGLLVDALEKSKTPFQPLDGSSIEGGDVLIDGKTIYVGVSERTTEAAIDLLKQQLPDYELCPLPLVGDILHLDCTFNIVSQTDALIYRDGLTDEAVELLEKRYNLIDVSADEQFTLGTNVLSIGDKKVISLPNNQAVNKQLKDKGYHVIEVAFDEIIKSGGSFRCCTLPVVRVQD